jgi:thiosulfate/3-mercaptopyruvate sulfurtransferase
VTLRHIPVDKDAYDFYGENLLPNFDALPTWAYTTPHNIQRNTPQTASCNSCHGNPDIFLTADKVAEEELQANQSVIIEEVPPLR